MSLSIVDRVKALELPLEQVIVAGSGILDALNIRKSDDVDLLASQTLYDSLREQTDTWSEESIYERQRLINNDQTVEVWYSWVSEAGILTFEQLKPSTAVVDDIRFFSLDYVHSWKCWMNRDKDQRDVSLIEEYRKVNK